MYNNEVKKKKKNGKRKNDYCVIKNVLKKVYLKCYCALVRHGQCSYSRYDKIQMSFFIFVFLLRQCFLLV